MRKHFSNVVNQRPYILKQLKDQEAFKRIDKLSIFEYFKLSRIRKTARPDEMIIKELTLFMHSNTFTEDFKYILPEEENKFKFFYLNLFLISYTIKNKASKNNLELNSRFKYTLLQSRLNFLPLTFWNYELVLFYIRKEYSIEHDNFLIIDELTKKYNLIFYQAKTIRKSFFQLLDHSYNNVFQDGKIELEEKDPRNLLCGKIFRNFLLDKDDLKYSISRSKLLMYFIAHVINI